MTRLMVSFRGVAAPAWVLDAIRTGEVGAVCLFAFNVRSPAQLRDLTDSLRDAARAGGHPPPLVGIDQEGGQLMAITGGATELPGNMALGAAGRNDLARRAGSLLGTELLAMGCTMNFAPVLDLAHHPDNPVVGLRSFGDDPARVAALGAAMIHGMQSVGLIATAKHVPGHGATVADSHHQAPTIDRTRQDLDEVEMAPFRAAARAGVGAMMTAHVTYPALDDAPATLSPRILRGLLRDELAYDGLVVTDAMDMGAMAHLSPDARCAAALVAGNDLVLLGHLPDQQGLVRRLSSDANDRSRRRIAAARVALPADLPDLDRVGCADHRALAQEIADAAVTVVRRGRLPLRPAADATVAVITVVAGNLTPADTSSATPVRLAAQIAVRHGMVRDLTLPYRADAAALADVLAASADAEHVVVGTVDLSRDPRQDALLRELLRRGQDVVHVALRTPYDLVAAPYAGAALCGYGARAANTEAVVRALFGEIEARGTLPCFLATPGPHDAEAPTAVASPR